MRIKDAREIVREGVALVTGEYLPSNLRLLDTSIETNYLYKILLDKAIDLVIQDYFTNFPLHLRKIVNIRTTMHFFGIDLFLAPEGLERIISVRDHYTKALIKRIDDIEKFIESQDPCYRYDFPSHKLQCRKTDVELELIYIDKGVYSGRSYLKNEYDQIELDSNLVIFAFCKELAVVQSAPPNKVEYFNNKYTNRLKYLITNEKYKENTVFDLSTKSNREVRL